MCRLSIIVAMANDQVIGINNTLPWHLPADLQFFKKTTMGKPMIMGRKTFDSIGKALPGRTTIVVTGQQDWQAEGVVVAPSTEQAIAIAKQVAQESGVDEIMVVGGATIYQALIAQVDRLYLTQVALQVEGDAFFPEFDRSGWQEVKVEFHEATATQPAYTFLTLDRV